MKLSKALLKPVIVSVCLVCFIKAFSQTDTAALSAKLTQNREKLGKDVAFILYRDGKMVYKKEMGKLNIKAPIPVGASSQWLTAALVMTFVQEGKLSLDDNVSTYLPIFSKYYKGFVTIRQCLTNYTGIQSEQGIAKLLQKNKFKSLEDEVDELASKRDIVTNAGTEFRYSNVGFDIVGRVLEVITKRTFERLIQERITRPLAMKNSTFTNEDYNAAVRPAMGARCSAADYINFLSMLLNKGSFNNKPVLTESSVATLLTLTTEASQVKYAPKPAEGLNYALGAWILETDAQGKASALAVPSLMGTWPIIDLCRGYACVVFARQIPGEQTRDLYMDIKATVDDMAGGNYQ